MSETTALALQNAKRPRKRVQKSHCECLTESETLERLKKEQEQREAKKRMAKFTKKAAKKVAVNPRIKLTKRNTPGQDERSVRAKKNLAQFYDESPSTSSDEDENNNSLDRLDDTDCSEVSENETENSLIKLMPIDIILDNTNKYVAAIYDGDWYLAIILHQDNSLREFQLKFLHPKGLSNFYHWPQHDDKCLLPMKNLLGILSEPPVPTNARATTFKISYYIIYNYMTNIISTRFNKVKY